MSIQRTRILQTIALAFGIAVWMFNASANVRAQSDEKSIGFLPSKTFMEPQIKVNEVRVGEEVRNVRVTRVGQAYETSSEDFKGGPDWLTHTSFQIENVSGKPIVYFSIGVRFPETKASGPIMVHSVGFGRRPGAKVQNGEPMLFMPNQTMTVSLGSEYAQISNFVGNRHPIAAINRIELEVAFIVFEDGSAWSAGAFMRQDPNNPNRYIPVETTLPNKP